MSGCQSVNRRCFWGLIAIASAVFATMSGGTVTAQQPQNGQYEAISVQIGAPLRYSTTTNGEWWIESATEELWDGESEENLFLKKLTFRNVDGRISLGQRLETNSGKVILRGDVGDRDGLPFVSNLKIRAPIQNHQAKQEFQFTGVAVYRGNQLGLLISSLDLNPNDTVALQKQADDRNVMTRGWDGKSIAEIDAIVKTSLRPNWMWIYLQKR